MLKSLPFWKCCSSLLCSALAVNSLIGKDWYLFASAIDSAPVQSSFVYHPFLWNLSFKSPVNSIAKSKRRWSSYLCFLETFSALITLSSWNSLLSRRLHHCSLPVFIYSCLSVFYILVVSGTLVFVSILLCSFPRPFQSPSWVIPLDFIYSP